MKSKQDPSPFESVHDDTGAMNDPLDTPLPIVSERRARVRTNQTSGFDATFLTLMGIVCLAIGLTLSLGPKLSWKLSQIATGFKHLGVEGGVLVMGGLVLVALGILRRGQIALRAPTVEQAEDRALLEQIAKDSLRQAQDLARIEDALEHIEANLEQVGTVVTDSRRALEERTARGTQEIMNVLSAPKDEGNADDAIYRLAASLDQVGMRIEQRLKTQYTALQDHLEDVGAAILSARNHVQGLHKTREEHAAELRKEVQTHVECALEETGFWAGERETRQRPSLGVLDSLDDPSAESQRLDQVEAALPLNPEEAREHGAATPAGLAQDDVDTKTRLVQLSTLLADPRLRRALEGITAELGANVTRSAGA